MSQIRAKLGAIVRVLPTARRNRTDLVRSMFRRPQILAGIGAYEVGLLASNRADNRLKLLAQLRTSSLIGCPY